MGAIHVRNLQAYTPTQYQYSDRVGLWMYRELYDIGRWQEIDKSADSEWTSASNILLSLSDFAVTVANPYVVTSATGGFTSSHEGKMLTLFATDDGNRSIYNVKTVVDSNTLWVDKRTRIGAWSSDESGISGRIHQASTGDPFNDANSYFVMQAPAASGRNIQVHVTHDSGYHVYARVYPYGDYATSARDTRTIEISDRGAEYYFRYNAYFADPTASEFYAFLFDRGDSSWYHHIVGELTDVAVGDTTPGFICGGGPTGFEVLSYNEARSRLEMLNETDTRTRFYPTYYKFNLNDNATTKREDQYNARRINDNQAKVFRPLVIGENTANGGFYRGRTPHSMCHRGYANDFFGTDWLKLGNHCIIPKNGTDDLYPMPDNDA